MFCPPHNAAFHFAGRTCLAPREHRKKDRMPRPGQVFASSLRNMKRKSHRAMPGAAEHRTVPHEISRLVRRERKFGGFTLLEFRVQVQFLEFQPMSHIFGRQYEDDWLALLQRYLCRGVRKSFYRNFDSPWSVRSRRQIQRVPASPWPNSQRRWFLRGCLISFSQPFAR